MGLGIVMAAAAIGADDKPTQPAKPPCVFDLPALAMLERTVAGLMAQKDYGKAETLLNQVLKQYPQEFNAHYNLACVLARQSKTADALEHLAKAVELGFHDVKHITADEDLASLRKEARFEQLVAQAGDAASKGTGGWKYSIQPAAAKDGQVTVSESNTVFNGQLGMFVSLFAIDDKAAAAQPVVAGYGKAGELLAQWYKEGTAAGNHGDLYDNRDGGHSFMNFKTFPQLTRVIYGEEVQKRRMNWGLQRWFQYNGVRLDNSSTASAGAAPKGGMSVQPIICLGNSSTALTGGPIWRCQGRLALTDPGAVVALFLQYVNRQLYMYPVHVDNNPGHNGAGGQGHGDVVPANTPYIILSQGSSGSDVVFLDAVAATLAAFRPDVKHELAASGLLMPTVQMIFRMSNKTVVKPEDYLTGKAHPTAFDGSKVDAEKMVTMAHDITTDALPPMVQIKVVEEDQPVVGRDYFDVAPRERLFDTPCAVARIVKSTQYERRMVVSAEGSKDLRGKPLTYHWVVLRGDEKRIHIKTLDAAGSKAELRVGYHERRPIAPGSDRESNRVDIGVVVHNGVYYSAPAFICFYTLDNEKRVYDAQNRIQVVDYADPAVRDNYVDPLLDLHKDWRDEYHYGDDGKPAGWTRIRGDRREEFTAEGLLVLSKDPQGQPASTCKVRYVAEPVSGRLPTIKEVHDEPPATER
jgi:hypothetical protein